MLDRYWVFQDDPNWNYDEIRIHKESCNFFRNRNPDADTLWHGPFDSYRAAEEFAQDASQRTHKNYGACGVCRPP